MDFDSLTILPDVSAIAPYTLYIKADKITYRLLYAKTSKQNTVASQRNAQTQSKRFYSKFIRKYSSTHTESRSIKFDVAGGGFECFPCHMNKFTC